MTYDQTLPAILAAAKRHKARQDRQRLMDGCRYILAVMEQRKRDEKAQEWARQREAEFRDWERGEK